MPNPYKILFFLFLVFSSIVVTAQIKTDKAAALVRFKTQFEQTLSETAQLKLPDNRALIYAKLGKLYWKFDQNRARQLFRKSIDEIIKAQSDAESDQHCASDSRIRDLLVYGETRRKILETIVYFDADLAFKSLMESRSARVIDAFAGISRESPFTTYNDLPSDQLIIQQETSLEQTLAEAVADQNPDRAVSILRNILQKNYFYKTSELLEKIKLKEPETADTLLTEIIHRVLAADFGKNVSAFNLAGNLIVESTRSSFVGSALKSDSQTLKKLAQKTADFLIAEADRNAQPSVTEITPTLIGILPERAVELKQKTKSQFRSYGGIFPINDKAAKLLQSDATAEKLLSEADRFPPAFREQIYVAAVNKIAAAGDVNRAEEILSEKFPAQRRSEMFADLNYQMAYRASENGDFDKASAFIDQLPENKRFDALINLAENTSKSPENNQKTLLVLGKARGLMPAAPTKNTEVEKFGYLAKAYALIEPETGFSIFDRTIEKVSEVEQSDFIVRDFQSNSNICHGEFVINSGSLFFGFAALQTTIDKLAEINFEKTIEGINKIQRREIRIMLQSQILETVSANKL